MYNILISFSMCDFFLYVEIENWEINIHKNKYSAENDTYQLYLFYFHFYICMLYKFK